MMDRRTKVTVSGDMVWTKTVVPDMGIYSPYYQGIFYVAERRETPVLNRVRLWLGLDSAEYHTVLVPDNGWVGSVRSTDSDTRDDSGWGVAIAELESRGYEVIDEDVAYERYGTDVESRKLRRRMDEVRTRKKTFENLSGLHKDVYDYVVEPGPTLVRVVSEELDEDRYDISRVLRKLVRDGVLEREFLDNGEVKYTSNVEDGGCMKFVPRQ